MPRAICRARKNPARKPLGKILDKIAGEQPSLKLRLAKDA
jgi:hypothetical protein